MCPQRLWQERLTQTDRDALRIYRLLGMGVVRDLKLTPLVFEMLGLRTTRREAFRLLDDLELIHQARHRPSEQEVDLG
jgi:hypothetical protein